MEYTPVKQKGENRWIGASIAILLLGASLAVAAAKPEEDKAAAKPSEPAANPTALVKMDVATFPKSTFNIPASPAEGRNPFFPSSAPIVPVVAPVVAAPSFDATVLVLNGITGPPLRSAMINGQTFLEGEESEVRLESGAKVLVKCEEIYDERAVVQVAGSRKELRLRSGI